MATVTTANGGTVNYNQNTGQPTGPVSGGSGGNSGAVTVNNGQYGSGASRAQQIANANQLGYNQGLAPQNPQQANPAQNTPPQAQNAPPVSTAQPNPATVNATAGLPGSPTAANKPIVGQSASGTPIYGGPGTLSDPNVFKQGLAATQASGTPAPQDAGAGRTAASQAVADASANQPNPTTPAVQNFYDPSTNKSMADQVKQLMEIVSPQSVTDNLSQELSKITGEKNDLAAEKLQLMNVQTVMAGTQQDIRDEVTKANGFATDSQVLALTTSRNATLLKQATFLQNQMTMLQDTISNDTSLYASDKADAQSQATQRMGIMQYIQTNQNNIASAARQSIDTAVKTPGGLTAYLNSPQDMANAEHTMGWAPGTIATMAKEAAKTQSLDNQVKQANINQSNAAAAKSRSDLGGGDPVALNAWTDAVKNGNATMAQVPAGYKNGVAMALDNGGTASYSPLAASRFTMAANRITTNYLNLPGYQLTANGLPYLQRIDAAMKNPGSVSDQDLLDSLTKLNTSGNAITDAQVHLITGGKSFADSVNVLENKLGNGGVLSNNQRQQIQSLAQSVYDNYKKGYQPIYDQVTKQFDQAGIPDAFRTFPDLNKLNAGQVGNKTDTTAQPRLLQPSEIQPGYYQASDGLLYKK